MPYLCISGSESLQLTISWTNSVWKYISSVIHIKQRTVQKTDTAVNFVKPIRKLQFFAKPNQKLNKVILCQPHTPTVLALRIPILCAFVKIVWNTNLFHHFSRNSFNQVQIFIIIFQ